MKKVILIVVSMKKKSIILKWRRIEVVITGDLIGHSSSEMTGTSIADLNMKK